MFITSRGCTWSKTASCTFPALSNNQDDIFGLLCGRTITEIRLLPRAVLWAIPNSSRIVYSIGIKNRCQRYIRKVSLVITLYSSSAPNLTWPSSQDPPSPTAACTRGWPSPCSGRSRRHSRCRHPRPRPHLRQSPRHQTPRPQGPRQWRTEQPCGCQNGTGIWSI